MTNEETIKATPDFLLSSLRSILDDTRPHGDHSYLGWYDKYVVDYNEAVEAEDLIKQYLSLESIYSLFYKHRTNGEVNEQLFILMNELVRIFMLIENKEEYSNFNQTRDHAHYNNAGKWKGRHCFRDAAILYENNQMYTEAIDMCQTALDLHYNVDGTRVGMVGRKRKLERKLEKKN